MTGSSTECIATLRSLKASSAQIRTPWISEVVLQTNQYDLMKSWYEAVLGCDWGVENCPDPSRPRPQRDATATKQVYASDVRACFMRLPVPHPYTMTFALFEVTTLETRPSTDPGLNHIQLKHADLQDLISRLEALRDHGLTPHRSANHGPSTSFYFVDPDQNVVELCIDNFDTPGEKIEFINSNAFKQNPSGIQIEFAEFISRYRAGISKQELLAI
jgi:catechol 2,3-dioxygenase-like lactoylglutathione lyase family enzyme